MVLLTWMYYSSFVLLAAGELAAELQAGTGRAEEPVASGEPIAGAGVPRRYALVPYTGRRRGTAGTGPDGGFGWAALDWIVPGRVVRRARQWIAAARDWMGGAGDQVRADMAAATREIGAMLRAVGTGTLLCATAATLALLGALSLVTGMILVIGDQWLPRDRYPLAALVVAVAAAAVTWLFARRGLAVLTSARGGRGEPVRS
jgi:hypothetical protein